MGQQTPCLKDTCEWPMVTVIMPIRNESAHIRSSLGGVLKQDYPASKTEVLIVDGQSEDGSRDIIAEMLKPKESSMELNGDANAGPGAAVRVLDNPLKNVPSALNVGLQHAQGEVIVRLDGHSEMAANYIRCCVSKLLERPDVACVGGPSVARGSGFVGMAYALALRSRFGVGGGTFRTLRNEAYVDTIAFGAYRRQIFEWLGNFDPSLFRNQDIEFNARVRRAGYKMLLINSTHTSYGAPSSVNALVKQCFNNGYWNTKILNKMIGVLSWRHFVPGLMVASLLVLSVLSLVWSKGLILLMTLLGTYWLAAVVASVMMFLREKSFVGLFLPPIFTAMHISYGFGSVCGLFLYVIGLRNLFKESPPA